MGIKRLSSTSWLWLAGITFAITISVGFRWVNFTLDRDLYGFGFSIVRYAHSHSAVVLDSFGIVAVVILMGAAAAIIVHRPDLLGLLGALLILLAFWAYLQVALGDSQLLLVLARQSDWWLII